MTLNKRMILTIINLEDGKVLLETGFDNENLLEVLDRIKIEEYGDPDQIEIVIKK